MEPGKHSFWYSQLRHWLKRWLNAPAALPLEEEDLRALLDAVEGKIISRPCRKINSNGLG
jgi:hypothetical protein